jgi:hypothetical protein
MFRILKIKEFNRAKIIKLLYFCKEKGGKGRKRELEEVKWR